MKTRILSSSCQVFTFRLALCNVARSQRRQALLCFQERGFCGPTMPIVRCVTARAMAGLTGYGLDPPQNGHHWQAPPLTRLHFSVNIPLALALLSSFWPPSHANHCLKMSSAVLGLISAICRVLMGSHGVLCPQSANDFLMFVRSSPPSGPLVTLHGFFGCIWCGTGRPWRAWPARVRGRGP